MNRRLLAAVGAVALVLGATAGIKVIRAGTPADGKHYGHVFVIMMENTGYRSLIGNPNAPWINRAVATYGVATSYYGVAHPSQPNYIAATSGLTGDHSNADQTLDVPNIVDQLESGGKRGKPTCSRTRSAAATPRPPRAATSFTYGSTTRSSPTPPCSATRYGWPRSSTCMSSRPTSLAAKSPTTTGSVPISVITCTVAARRAIRAASRTRRS